MAEPSSARRRRRVLSTWLLTASLVLSAAVTSVAAPAVAAPDESGLRAEKSQGAGAPKHGLKAGEYVVVLRDPAAARYTGGIPGLKASAERRKPFSPKSTAVRKYVDHLKGAQRSVANDAGVKPFATYQLTTNGFAARLSAKQANALANDPRVQRVVKSELLKVQDATTSTGYLGLEGADGVWQGIGGEQNAGAGVVVGVLDTGIAPENPSFAGAPLGTDAGAEPYRDGDAIVFDKSDGSQFRGVCQTGSQFGADECSTKIIGARWFVDGFGADSIGDESIGEYLSPRDGGSHGSHTASTAAGAFDVDAGQAHISGVAPAAKIAVYKVCWSGEDATTDRDDGCAFTDLLSAIDAAVADGVDVINYSIGGGSAASTNEVTDQAFMAAASAGVFVAAAAGNDGPDATTLSNASPWITTVAASTFPTPVATVSLGSGENMLGASITVPDAGITGPFVEAASLAVAGASSPRLCGPNTLDPAKAVGKIVLCDRGTVDRVAKSAEVKRAGGIGMVLVNTSPDSTDFDAHSVPTVHVDADSADLLHTYAQTTGATVTLRAGNPEQLPVSPAPQIAGFSSRGPIEVDGSDLIKPDIAAPGVNVLAAYANADGATPKWGYMSGTSMASPHVAGLAALYQGTLPAATPAEIKSAIMTSATDTVDAAGDPVADPFAQGNGQVVPKGFLDPGLVYLSDVDDWNGYLAGIGQPTSAPAVAIDGSDLNLPSIGIGSMPGRQTITRTVTATHAGTFTASVTGLPGVTATVEPSTLTFAEAGEQRTFTVSFLRTDAALEQFSTGTLTWSDGESSVRSALAVRPSAFDAPESAAGIGTTGSAEFQVSLGEDASIPVATAGLARGDRAEGTITEAEGTQRYAVDIPEGASFARFDLDTLDETGDLDLQVWRREANGDLTSIAGYSATDSPDERVDLTYLEPGTYVAIVQLYRPGQSAGVDYELTSYVVSPETTDGGLQVTPNPVAGAVGDSPTVTASWSDLAPGQYVGVVSFGDTGRQTLIEVDAGEDVPAEPGIPTLTVDPGADEWVARGADLRLTAAGLIPGATYSVSFGDGDVVRSGRAGASGAIDWTLVITDEVPLGDAVVHVRGEGADLSAAFRVTPVAISEAHVDTRTALNAQVFTTALIFFTGHGDVRYRFIATETGEVLAEGVTSVAGPAFAANTPTVPTAAVEMHAELTPVIAEGVDGPTFTTTSATPDTWEPGSVVIEPSADGASTVDVTLTNNGYYAPAVTVQYRTCDSRRIDAHLFVPTGEASQTWNVAGVTEVSVIDEYGQVLATHQVASAAACDPTAISITQDFWVTLSATPQSDGAYEAERPITMELSNRYAPRIDGFQFVVGAAPRESQPFLVKDAPTEYVEERGPIETATVQVAENTRHWALIRWNEKLGPIWLQKGWWHWSAPVSVAELQSGDATPPTTTLSWTPAEPDGEHGWYVSKPSFTLSATDVGGSGVGAVQYRIGGGRWLDYVKPVTVDAQGEAVVQYRTTDTAGNAEEIRSTTVRVDSVAPTSTASAEVVGDAMRVSVDADDAASRVAGTSVRVDDGEWAAYTAPIAVAGAGEHVVEYRSTDFAGNQEEVRRLTVIVPAAPAPDSRAPSTVSASADEVVFGDDASIDVKVTPAAHGRIEVRLGGELLGWANAGNGKATVKLKNVTLTPGEHLLGVTYEGDRKTAPSATTLELTVSKATPKVSVKAAKKVDASSTTIEVRVAGVAERAATGAVKVSVGSRTLSIEAAEAWVPVRIDGLSQGDNEITVMYEGDVHYAAGSAKAVIKAQLR